MMLLRFALLPVAVLIFWILFNDRENKEPFSQLVKAFFVGVAIALPVIFVELYLGKIDPFMPNSIASGAYDCYVVAGFTEEAFKLLAVLIFFFGSVHFNEKMDGIVYCAMVSLGFAAIENVLYLTNALNMQELYSLALMRGVFSVPAHCIFSIFMGFFLSKVKYGKTPVGKFFSFLGALVIPIAVHGTYDFIITVLGENSTMVLAGYMVFMLILAILCVKIYRRDAVNHSRRRLF